MISSIGLDDFVNIVGANFQEYAERIDESRLPFDFVWFDCGGLKEYFIFYHEYWKFVDPNGGLLLMHSTLTNLEIMVLFIILILLVILLKIVCPFLQ